MAQPFPGLSPNLLIIICHPSPSKHENAVRVFSNSESFIHINFRTKECISALFGSYGGRPFFRCLEMNSCAWLSACFWRISRLIGEGFCGPRKLKAGFRLTRKIKRPSELSRLGGWMVFLVVDQFGVLVVLKCLVKYLGEF